jgi:integrase
MIKNEGTNGNPKDCEKIASCKKLEISGLDSANGGEGGRKARAKGISRTHVAYWKKALRVDRVTGNFFVEIFYDKRRGRFTFDRNAEAAAEKARLIFLCIQKEGWETAAVRFAPGAATRKRNKAEAARVISLEGRIEEPTVGDLIRVAGEFSAVRPSSFHGYVKALRFIVSEAFTVAHLESVPVPDKKSGKRRGKKTLIRIKDVRHDYRSGGLAKWREAVDAVKLSSLTPDKVQAWRKSYLERAGADPVAVDRARVSFNKTIRNAKALFGRKLIPMLEKRLVLARPLPFDGVSMEKEPPMRYQSRIDPGEVLSKAASELQPVNSEAYKALVLCLVLGLRRTEADTLLWRQVDFDRKEVSIEPTEHYWLKSRDSARVLALDDGSLALLRGWRALAKGAFVLESPLKSKPNALTPVWRCGRTFKALADWLRTQGVTARKPIHELRKEAGTILLKQGQPIESVSRYLGHSTIGITLKHYADLTKRRATVDMAALMPLVDNTKSLHFPGPVEEGPKKTAPINKKLPRRLTQRGSP